MFFFFLDGKNTRFIDVVLLYSAISLAWRRCAYFLLRLNKDRWKVISFDIRTRLSDTSTSVASISVAASWQMTIWIRGKQTALTAGGMSRQRFSEIVVKVGHILREPVKGVLMLFKVRLQSFQSKIPLLAFWKIGKGELPFLKLVMSFFNRRVKIFWRQALADVFAIYHIPFHKLDNERWTLRRFKADFANMSDFDGWFWEFLEGRHEVGFMPLVVLGDFGKIVKKSVFDHKESSIAEDARLAAFFYDFWELE